MFCLTNIKSLPQIIAKDYLDLYYTPCTQGSTSRTQMCVHSKYAQAILDKSQTQKTLVVTSLHLFRYMIRKQVFLFQLAAYKTKLL